MPESNSALALMMEEDYADYLLRSGLVDVSGGHQPSPSPMHRYSGTVTLQPQALIFQGMEAARPEREKTVVVKLAEVVELSLSMDPLLEAELARRHPGTHALLPPLRVVYNLPDGPETLYFYLDYDPTAGTTANTEWYRRLQQALKAIHS
ncbi:MAG: hypothetical protein M0Z27_04705 [Thermaerobacter sp.]|nr:hypothetical protein [Thermaerobacter sp.]